MKQTLLLPLCMASLIGVASGDVILTYGTAGSTTSLAPLSADSNITAANLEAGAGIDVQAFSTFNFSNWDPLNTSYDLAVAADEKWTWGFTVGSGSINLTTLDIRLDRSSSGPDDFEIKAVVTPNGGPAGAPILIHAYDFGDASSGVNFPDLDLSSLGTLAAGDQVEFILAAFNSESAGGTFDLETIEFGQPEAIVINGTIAGVTPDLSVVLDQSVLFEDAPVGSGLHTGTVSRTGVTTDPVTVNIVSSAPGTVTVEASVTILAAESSAQFEFDPAADVNGAQVVTFDFSAAGYNSTSAEVTVLDDEVATADVVINELLFTVTGADSEFVELYNKSGGPLDIQGWTFKAYGGDSEGFPFGAETASVTIPTGAAVVIPDQGFYLIANSQFETIYAPVTADLLAPLDMDNNSVTFALFDAAGNLVFSASGTDGDGVPNIGGSEFVDEFFTSFTPDLEFGPDGPFTPAGFRFTADGGTFAELLEFMPQPSVSATPGASNVLTPELTLTISPGIVAEDGGTMAAVGTITRRYLDPSSPLTVTLSDDDVDDSEISIPASVTILADETSATFEIGTLTDGIQDGAQTVIITATDGGGTYLSSQDDLVILDIDTPVFTDLVINEIDSDQVSSDTAEFIELYNLTDSEAALDGLVLVFFNGRAADETSYQAIDLTGQIIPASGYFVVGNQATVANVDLDFVTDLGLADNNVFQNGADAVALFVGSSANFPGGTTAADAVANNTLIDVILYDTGQEDDAGLAAAFPSAVQFNENENGNKDTESVSRNGDGSAELVAATPTPGASNGSVATADPVITGIARISPATVQLTFTGNPGQTYVLKSDPDVQSGFATVVPVTGGSLITDGSGDGSVEFAFVPGDLYFRIEE